MATVNSPNMVLPVPVVGQETGPQWATDLNNCLTIIDSHDHTPGRGVQITPSGLNINSDLTFNTNNAISLRSVRLSINSAAIALASDLNCLYDVNGDLYFNDGLGNQIRITQSGSVSGAAGTITGLPSGSASASFNSIGGVFTFQQASNQAANLDVGPIVIRNTTVSSAGITITPISGLASNYTLTLPALPSVQNIMMLDNSGNITAPLNVDNSTIEISSNNLQVKNLGITAAKIANSTITGTQVASNINLPGDSVQENGRNVIVSSTNAASSLAIIRGTVDYFGAIIAGEGFTISNPTGGTFIITFTVPFNSGYIPTAIVTPNGTTGSAQSPRIVALDYASGQVTMYANNGSGTTGWNQSFNFMIIGPR